MDPVEPVESADSGGEAAASSESWRIGPVFKRWTWLLVIVLLGTVAFLSQTTRGQQLVLDALLSRVEGVFAGELAVAEIRSGTLLTGATLGGVTLDAADGRRFLNADSIQIRYTPLGLLAGRPRSVLVWGLDVEISRYPSEEQANVARLLQPREPAESRGLMERQQPQPPPIRFRRIGVRGGTVAVLNPAPPGAAGPTVPSPDGEGRLTRLAFSGLDLDLEEVLVRLDGRDDPFRARLASLSVDIELLEDPIVIQEAFGSVAFGSEGLRVLDAAVRMPESLIDTDLTLGPRADVEDGPWILDASFTTQRPGMLADLRWLDPRLPDGTFSGAARVTVDQGAEVRLDDVLVELEASTIAASGTVLLADGLRLDGLELTLSPLALSRLEPWTGRPAPLDGWLSGQVRLSGTPERLATSGRVTLVPAAFGGAPTTADFGGTVFTGANPGANALEVRLNPLNYAVVQAVAPSVALEGRGRLDFQLSGRRDGVFQFVANALHQAEGLSDSRARVSGSLRQSGTDAWYMDLEGDLTDVSLGMLRGMSPDLDDRGEVNGSFTALGRLRDLQVQGDFDAADGRVSFDGVFDMRRPGAFYRFDARADDVALSRFDSRLPEPSLWSGGLSMEGRGVKPDSMDAALTLRSSRARFGGLHIDTVTAYMRASAGILAVDSLDALVGGVQLNGTGRLGLAAPLDGEARLSFSTESLEGLRPLILGDTVIARDTLSAMESALLAFEGVDLEALPDTLDVRMRGRAQGTLRLVGSVDALDVELELDLRDAVYGPNQVDSVALSLTANDLPGFEGNWDVSLDASGLLFRGRSLDRARLQGTMLNRSGEATLEIDRRPGDALTAAGDFALDSLGGRVGLERALLTLDSETFALSRPTSLAWDSTSVTVTELEIGREGEDPMRLVADGRLDRAGGSDFSLRVTGLHLERLSRVAEIEGVDLAGHADARITIGGLAGDPAIFSTWTVFEPRVGDVGLTRVEGEFEYFSRRADVRFDAWSDSLRVFRAAGAIPVDLRFGEVENRITAEAMDVTVQADSLPASVALAYFPTLEDPVGTVSGSVRLRGTIDAPEPDGVIRVFGAAWSIDAVGVRHRDVNGTLRFNPDRTLAVDLTTTATGRSAITGTVGLNPITDPTFDLGIEFGRFQVVERLDMEGRVSGRLALQGRYGRPRITGALSVDEGTLYVDEFARNADVVDLSDPRLFGADTTIFETQPLLRSLRNPFLQALQVEVDLAVPRNTWLRSEDMAVEMGGELLVRYDRMDGDIVLVGTLEALRGSYTVLGRTFEVTGGTVGFIGTPGVNPTLDIQASTQIRRLDDEDLAIDATVEGTLTTPRVSLSTEEAGLVQSDLISYLIFGRPSSELASGGSGLFGTSSVAGAALSGATTLVTGAVASRLGSQLAQGIGVDYLSFSQAGQLSFAEFASPLANTQVEIGRYVGRDAFIVVVLRPLRNQSTELNFLGGARIEYELNDDYSVEAFFEDRFLRRGRAGFAGAGLPTDQILGIFIFREFGY